MRPRDLVPRFAQDVVGTWKTALREAEGWGCSRSQVQRLRQELRSLPARTRAKVHVPTLASKSRLVPPATVCRVCGRTVGEHRDPAVRRRHMFFIHQRACALRRAKTLNTPEAKAHRLAVLLQRTVDRRVAIFYEEAEARIAARLGREGVARLVLATYRGGRRGFRPAHLTEWRRTVRRLYGGGAR